MTLDELIVRIRVAADGADGELDGVLADLKRFVSDAEKSTKSSADAQAAAWAGLAAAAGVAFRVIVGAIQTGIDASNQYKSAVMGLESVAQANNIGSGALKEALASVTDEFFNAAAASTAFKNLLSRGYTLDQAVQTITRLKDAAAFGRQASYGLADAVVSATEGIKNENSVLVDNAGVTKNVAKMWEDYAKARGVATASLTQAQKVEAEYLGILEETKAQMGDLGKLSQGLAGSQAEAANQSQLLAQSFGEAMTPMVQAGTEMFSGLLSGLTGVTEAFPGVTAGATGAAAAFTALVTAASGLATIKKLLKDLNITKNLTTPLGIAAAALGVLVGAYTAIKKHQEEIAKREEERVAKVKEEVAGQKERVKTLEQLTQRYKELSGKSNLDYSEQKELIGIQHDLAAAYGVTAESIDGANDSAKEYLATLKLLHTQELKDLQAKQKEASQAAFVKANSAEVIAALERQKKLKEEIAEIANSEEYKANSTKAIADWETLEKELKNEEAILQRHKGLFAEWFKAAAEEGLTGAALAGEIINTALSDMLIDMFDIDLTKFGGDLDAANKWVDSMVGSLVEAASNADTSAALTAVTGVMDNIKKGITPSEEDITTFSEGWAKLIGGESPLIEFIKQLVEITEGDLATVTNQFLAMLLGLEDVDDAMMLLESTGEELGGTLKGMANHFSQLNSETDATRAAAELATNGMQEYGKAIKDADAQIGRLTGQKQALDTMKALAKQYKEGIKNNKDMSKTQALLEASAKAAGVELKYENGQLVNLDQSLQTAEKNMETSAAAMVSGLEDIIASLEAEKIALEAADGQSIDVDTGPAIASINAAIKVAQFLLSLLGQFPGADSKPKSGGGGGKKEDPEEEARRAAEKARQEALRKAYELLEHKKHLNQLTLEDELRMLEEIREKHRLNAEEIMDWEEKVYDVKKALRERDASSVDKMGDAIIDALAARYEAMLEAEIERLDASRKAWEEWRDGSVKAIQDQIKALDELAETEDREKKDQEELRKIAKLRQDIEFEQDDYNRMKLQQQLDQAISARDDRLHRQDIQDQKDALQKQIESIEEQADAQLKALDEEQESIEKTYAERMKSAALRAEAEKMIMRGNQQEIIDLIGEFAPDYDALGKTLGEKLLDGFKNKVGNVVDWFKKLNDSLYAIQEDAAAQAVSAADSFYAGQQRRQQQSAPGNTPPATVVNQTVNFNQPVESPSQAARRVAEANEALADQLLNTL